MIINVFLAMGIGIAILVALLILLDLLFAHGAGTLGIMRDTAVMANRPIGQGILFVLLAILGVLVYAVFFR